MEVKTELLTYDASPYDALIAYSEICPDEMTTDKCENAKLAMATVLKHGTCYDVATAMQYFMQFIMNAQK